jgi:GMP synthase-like glutamine amidotransferase
MRIRVIKHEKAEGPGSIAAWAAARGHVLECTELESGEPLPDPDSFDALVLMGGSMSVNEEDRFAWLKPEKALARRALAENKRVLGICLGAQMIASASGAEVRRNPEREIGWFPLANTQEGLVHPLWRSVPDGAVVFHWHGETFDLPAGAVGLARSPACEHQAFALGERVLGLQCHLEMDAEALDAMVRAGSAELRPGRWVQSAEELLSRPDRLRALEPLSRGVLDSWATV